MTKTNNITIKNLRDGATFTPNIDSNGLLSWSNDKALENPNSYNINHGIIEAGGWLRVEGYTDNLIGDSHWYKAYTHFLFGIKGKKGGKDYLNRFSVDIPNYNSSEEFGIFRYTDYKIDEQSCTLFFTYWNPDGTESTITITDDDWNGVTEITEITLIGNNNNHKLYRNNVVIGPKGDPGITPEFAESEEWLANNGDTNKLYVLPDGYIYAYMLTDVEVESDPAYTNKLSLATDTDRITIYGGDYNGDGVNDGYITGYRLTSSGGTSALSNACASGFIPAKVGDVLRIKGITPIQGTASQYVITYNSSNTVVKHLGLRDKDDNSDWGTVTTPWWKYENGIITITLESGSFGSDFNAIRFSAGIIDNNTIVTVNEEIVEGGTTETIKEYRWANTGHAFVPADYEDRILDLENEVERIDEIDARLENVESGISNLTEAEKLEKIRQWDAPIYDKAPVFLLDAEKTALTSADKTVAAVYAKYDALMAEHPDFITRTDLGLCSDGVTHVYRYDFKEKESRHQSGFEWSESKPKFIVVTGIHREWNGIYSMYNALAEIASNKELAELRRNVHFIVIPVLNPYSISGPYATVGHAANANGVEIHRNFEVGFTVSGEGTIHYTGEAPLSEVESQYLNNILADNNDAAYFLTCHSFDRDRTWGVGFLWGSSATKYMCNMAFRVIDKMGKAWHEKYGAVWEEGIARENANGTTALEDGDYRIGHAALTNTGGCEQRQATKYGIQATNFEVGETFFVLDKTMLSAKAVTHGTEAYINFFLTAMGVYPETRFST